PATRRRTGGGTYGKSCAKPPGAGLRSHPQGHPDRFPRTHAPAVRPVPGGPPFRLDQDPGRVPRVRDRRGTAVGGRHPAVLDARVPAPLVGFSGRLRPRLHPLVGLLRHRGRLPLPGGGRPGLHGRQHIKVRAPAGRPIGSRAGGERAMVDEPEVIQQQMEQTRASLSAKLEDLERKVVETVHGAKEAVHETVETVKETVHESVETVKETFDLRLQVERHPWAMLGIAAGAGYLSGMLLNRAGPATSPAAFEPAASSWTPPAPQPAAAFRDEAASPKREEGAGLVHQLANKFSPEIDKLKGLALGTLFAVVRDVVSQSAPEPLKPQLREVVDNITVKLGGKPIHGPILTGHNGHSA